MPVDEYWYADPSLIYCYEKAYKDNLMFKEYEMWLNGVYEKSALSSTQLWTVQPMEKRDWNKMPKYAKNPLEKHIKERKSEEYSEEDLKLRRQMAYDNLKTLLFRNKKK